MSIRRLKVRNEERGLLYRDGVLSEMLQPGVHWRLGWPWKLRLERVSVRDAWITHPDLQVLVRYGLLPENEAQVLDLDDEQRAIVRVDGRYDRVVGPGLHAVWTVLHDVEAQILEATEPLISDPRVLRLVRALGRSALERWVELHTVDEGQRGLLYIDGELTRTLAPGRYALWKNVRQVRLEVLDVRERMLDVNGQDIMTADRVTLRLNAMLVTQVTDPAQAASVAESYEGALYREAQLALRAAVGARDLDTLLVAKDELSQEALEAVRPRAAELGVAVKALGVRDIILPGDMKELLNRVIEAQKAAEANLVTRREETAAMRSQANTAKLLESNPALMRLRELEVLEKVADNAQLTVMLGEGGLADKVVKLV